MFRNTSTVQLIHEDVQDVQLIHYNVEKVESTYAGKRSQFHYQVLSWSFLEYFLYTQYHVHRKEKRFRATAIRCDLYSTVPIGKFYYDVMSNKFGPVNLLFILCNPGLHTWRKERKQRQKKNC